MRGFIAVGAMESMPMSDTNRKQIAIIDYGMGNLFNVQCACSYAGLRSVVTADKNVITHSTGIILPGVGAFGDAMNNLHRLDLIGVIKDHIELGKPFLGICLGMQLLLSKSEEFGGHNGLDVISGEVVRFDNKDDHGRKVKVPQVGWNQVCFNEGASEKKRAEFFRDVADKEYMYFVHSYYAIPENASVVSASTRYGNKEYASAIIRGSVFAVQFHPEKSGPEGLKFYKNWARIIHTYEESAKQ